MGLLFSNEGAGLDVYRYNIPAGSPETVDRTERRTPDIETAPGVYELTADANGLHFLAMARDLGVEHFVLFANSPPARMTRSGKTSGGLEGKSNLDIAAVDEFARYLVDVAEKLQTNYQLPHVTLSPINEPQWNWGKDGRGQEGCHYTPEEAKITLRAVFDEIERRGLDIRLEGPESGAWGGSEDYAKAVFGDPVLNENLDTFALHSYWTKTEDKQRVAAWFNENHPGKTISMTEFCEMRWGHGTGIDEGLHLAEVMHDDMTIGSVVTWQWWLAIAAGGYNDGLIYAHPESGKIDLTKRLWVMAHYARFVEPGSTRVAVSASSSAITVSAYLTPGKEEVVLVVTNHGTDAVTARIGETKDDRMVLAGAWLTDAEHDLAEIAVKGSMLELPARSIITAKLR